MWVKYYSYLILLSTIAKVYQRTVNSDLDVGYPLEIEN